MSSVRESFLHGRILGTEDPWTLVRHFQLGMPSLGKPSNLSFWGCHDLEVSRVLSAQSCRVPSGLPSRAIPTSHDPHCLPTPLPLSPTALGHQEERLCLPIQGKHGLCRLPMILCPYHSGPGGAEVHCRLNLKIDLE